MISETEKEIIEEEASPRPAAICKADVDYLMALVVKAREVVLLCAPQFAAGSDGAQIFAAIRDCLPNLRAIAQKAVTSAEPAKEAADEGAHD